MRKIADETQQDLHPLDFAAIVADKLGTADTEDSSGEAAPADTEGEQPTPVDATAESPTEPEAATEPETTPLPEGVYEDENGRLRGPDGKFVSAEGHDTDPEATPDPEANPVPEEWTLDIDEDVQSFLAKYDGDLNKALRGAVEAQKTVGRQGSELGELRRMQQELEALRTEVQQRGAPQPTVPLPNYGEMIEEDPRAAAITAYDNGHYDAMGAALRAWAADDPVEARLFAMNVKHEADLMEARARTDQAAGTIESQSFEQEFTSRVADVVSRHPDLEAMLPQIGEVSKERPLLREVLETGSPADRAAALEDLYLIAKSRSVASDTSDAVRKVQVRVSDEAREARAAAAVVSGSGASAGTGDPPTGADLFRNAFSEHMRELGLSGE